MSLIEIRDIDSSAAPWELADLSRLKRLLLYFQSKTTDVEIDTQVDGDGSFCLQYQLDNIRSRFYDEVCVQEVLYILGDSTAIITALPDISDDAHVAYPQIVVNLKVPTRVIWRMYNKASAVQIVDLVGIELASKFFDLIADAKILQRVQIAQCVKS